MHGCTYEGEHNISITIEDDCRIAARCTISAKNSIHLERNVVLASDVLVMDHDHVFEDVSTAIWRQGTTQGGRIRIRGRMSDRPGRRHFVRQG